MDVRDTGTGHIAWTDVSRPGESPRYVTEDSSGGSALPALPAREMPASGAAAKGDDEKTADRDGRAHSM
jgi:hypothetical protein